VVEISHVEYVQDYTLKIQFSDGLTQHVDFGPFLQSSLNLLIRKYLDLDLFRDFTVADGDLYWHDYSLCFPIADLYENSI
jgi:hypothetical protein